MLKRILKKFLKPVRRNQAPKKLFVLGSNSIDQGVKVIVRSNMKHMTERKGDYLQIGSDSIVAGNFVFENSLGTIKIGNRSFVGGGDFICINEIVIGDDVLISWGCTFMDNNAHAIEFDERRNDVVDWKRGIEERRVGYYKNWQHVKSRPIVIKDKAWIGFKSIILKGVTVGEGAIIGAGSVVTTDIPNWCIVAGNPAKVIRFLK